MASTIPTPVVPPGAPETPSAAPAAASPVVAMPVAPAPAAPPSVHVRAAITWLAIFPLVSISMLVLGPVTDSWHPVLRAFVLTLIVVPLAVYVVVPRLLRVYARLVARRRAR